MRFPQSLPQGDQAQLPQHVSRGEVLQPSDHLRGSPLNPLHQLHIFLVLWAAGLDAVLQIVSHEGTVEGDNTLPLPAGHPFFDAVQDTVGLSKSYLFLIQSAYPSPLIYTSFGLPNGQRS